jgi:hypothetical protein
VERRPGDRDVTGWQGPSTGAPSDQDQPDQVDVLFGRLATLDAPGDLAGRVLARTTRARETESLRRRELVWAALDAVALVALAALSVSLGWALSDSGAAALIGAAFGDLASVADGWTDVLPALLETLPWAHIVGLAINVAVVAVLSRYLIAAVATSDGRLVGGGARPR